jgi:hypothetical protein
MINYAGCLGAIYLCFGHTCRKKRGRECATLLKKLKTRVKGERIMLDPTLCCIFYGEEEDD